MRMQVSYNFHGSVEYQGEIFDTYNNEIVLDEFRCYKDIRGFYNLLEAIDEHKTIKAIKIHRANTGATLKDAKEFVESITYQYVADMKIKLKSLRETNPEYFI